MNLAGNVDLSFPTVPSIAETAGWLANAEKDDKAESPESPKLRYSQPALYAPRLRSNSHVNPRELNGSPGPFTSPGDGSSVGRTCCGTIGVAISSYLSCVMATMSCEPAGPGNDD